MQSSWPEDGRLSPKRARDANDACALITRLAFTLDHHHPLQQLWYIEQTGAICLPQCEGFHREFLEIHAAAWFSTPAPPPDEGRAVPCGFLGKHLQEGNSSDEGATTSSITPMSMEKGVEDKESVREAEVIEDAATKSAWSTSRWELWSFYLYYVVRYLHISNRARLNCSIL